MPLFYKKCQIVAHSFKFYLTTSFLLPLASPQRAWASVHSFPFGTMSFLSFFPIILNAPYRSSYWSSPFWSGLHVAFGLPVVRHPADVSKTLKLTFLYFCFNWDYIEFILNGFILNAVSFSFTYNFSEENHFSLVTYSSAP